MNRRQLHVAVISFLAFVVFANVANGQSTDRDNPTQLTSGEVSGLINNETKGNFYYYSFIVNPGEVSISLSLTPDSGAGVLQVLYTLYDRNADGIVSKYTTTSSITGTSQVVGRVNITHRQTVILAVNIRDFDSGTGKYRLKIDGATEFGAKTNNFNAALAEAEEREKKKGNCLPKQGTLIIKMKDGSKKIIDLSEAETVTVVP